MQTRLLLPPVAALLLATQALAQTPAPLPATYTPVAITLPAPPADPSFAAFRLAIAAAAKRRLYADLEALVQPQGFFWDRDFGNGFDPRKPATDNLAMAISLEHRDGAGWDRLAAFAAETSAEPLGSRPGVVCAPARPDYDAVAFSKLLDASYTTEADWAYPLAGATPVRAAPRTGARGWCRLAPHFVRLLGLEGPDGEGAAARNRWARIVLPDGKAALAPPGSLSLLAVERLCYIKDMVAGWRIAGFIGN